jgi:hypothetical protein
MVDNAATFGSGGGLDPGGPRRRPGRKHKRPPPPKRPGNRAQNPPQIDIVNAASPVEESPIDYTNATTVFSTGQGGAEMYHYDRAPMHTQEQLARPESTQITGPGQVSTG